MSKVCQNNTTFKFGNLTAADDSVIVNALTVMDNTQRLLVVTLNISTINVSINLIGIVF